MLNISNRVEKSFRAPTLQAFYSNLSEDLRRFLLEIHPDIDEGTALRQIRAAYEICRRHDFITERQITRLSFIIVTFPEDFSSQPDYAWFGDLLKAQAPADDKISRIVSVIERNGSS